MEFTKKDIKSGMGIITRNGTNFLVVDHMIVNKYGYKSLYNYSDNLMRFEYDDKGYDIIKVYSLIENQIYKFFSRDFNYNINDANLIWERKEAKEITAEEACRIIKEKCGEDVVIKL